MTNRLGYFMTCLSRRFQIRLNSLELLTRLPEVFATLDLRLLSVNPSGLYIFFSLLRGQTSPVGQVCHCRREGGLMPLCRLAYLSKGVGVGTGSGSGTGVGVTVGDGDGLGVGV